MISRMDRYGESEVEPSAAITFGGAADVGDICAGDGHIQVELQGVTSAFNASKKGDVKSYLHHLSRISV